MHVLVCPLVNSQASCVPLLGQVRPTCQCAGHLWRPCHPPALSAAPKQEGLGGGNTRRAVPKLSLFITATEMGRGRQVARPLVATYCDHLPCHSAAVWVGGCSNALGLKKQRPNL